MTLDGNDFGPPVSALPQVYFDTLASTFSSYVSVTSSKVVVQVPPGKIGFGLTLGRVVCCVLCVVCCVLCVVVISCVFRSLVTSHSGMGANLPISLIVGGQLSNANFAYSYNPPVITNLRSSFRLVLAVCCTFVRMSRSQLYKFHFAVFERLTWPVLASHVRPFNHQQLVAACLP